MSVIIENSKGEIWLLTKGAESSIIPKCDQGPAEDTLKHVMDFALVIPSQSFDNYLKLS